MLLLQGFHPVRRPRHADGRHDLPVEIEDRRRHTTHFRLVFAPVEAVAPIPNAGQLGQQRLDGRHGVGREAVKGVCGEVDLHLLGFAEGKEHLPDAGAVRGRMATDARRHQANRVQPLQLLQIDHLHLVQHGQMDRLRCVIPQLLHDGQGCLAHVAAGLECAGQGQAGQAETIDPRWVVALDVVVLGKSAEKAKCRAGAQVDSVADVGQAAGLAVGEKIQDAQAALHRPHVVTTVLHLGAQFRRHRSVTSLNGDSVFTK